MAKKTISRRSRRARKRGHSVLATVRRTVAGLHAAGVIGEQSQHALIESTPSVLGGEPVIRNTRVPTRVVADLVKKGASKAQIRDAFDLTTEQIDAAVAFEA